MVSPVAEQMAIIMRQRLVQFFLNEGRPPHEAEYLGNELGRKIEEDLVRNLGGLRLTIPTVKNIVTRDKHRQIRSQFNGANVPELALKFHYSRSTIYGIVLKKEKWSLTQGMHN